MSLLAVLLGAWLLLGPAASAAGPAPAGVAVNVTNSKQLLNALQNDSVSTIILLNDVAMDSDFEQFTGDDPLRINRWARLDQYACSPACWGPGFQPLLALHDL